MTVSAQVSSQGFYDQVIGMSGATGGGHPEAGRLSTFAAGDEQAAAGQHFDRQPGLCGVAGSGVLRCVRSQAITSTVRRAAAGFPVPRKTAVSQQPRKVRFGELFEEIFSVANDPEVVPPGPRCPVSN